MRIIPSLLIFSLLNFSVILQASVSQSVPVYKTNEFPYIKKAGSKTPPVSKEKAQKSKRTKKNQSEKKIALKGVSNND